MLSKNQGLPAASSSLLELLQDRRVLQALLEEVRAIEARTVELECTLSQQARADASVRRAMEVPGIGLLTPTSARS